MERVVRHPWDTAVSWRLKPGLGPLGALVLGLLLVMGGMGCSQEASTRIRIVGSTTVLPIVSRAAEVFHARHPEVTITVSPGGSGVGVRSVAEDLAEIGMLSRPLSPVEAEQYKDLDLRIHPIGRDGVACVVSAPVWEAGVRVLSREQIAAIYRGAIRNWKEVGGPDRPILVVDKENHRGTRQVFMRWVFGDPLAPAPGAQLVAGSNNEEQAKIAGSDSAIGLLSLEWTNDRVRAVALRVGNRVIPPTREAVRRGEYPISRDLSLLTKGPPEGWVKRFIQFLQGPEGQRLVERSGFVALQETGGGG